MPRKKKVSEAVDKGLNKAVEEALNKIKAKDLPQEDIQEIQEAIEPKKKRHRRTKAEIQAAREEEQKQETQAALFETVQTNMPYHVMACVDWDTDDEEITIPKMVPIPDNILVDDYSLDTVSDYLSDLTGYCHKGFTICKPDGLSHDDFCKWELYHAHLMSLEDPDFDFRNFYLKGDYVYLVRHYETINSKTMDRLYLRTIYPRMMVGVSDNSFCECIGMNELNNIFTDYTDAKKFYDTVDGISEEEYDVKTGKNKSKRKVTNSDIYE